MSRTSEDLSHQGGPLRRMPSPRPPPRSPNIQNYRPQLTSVLSIANRITAVISAIAIVALVAWLVAAALGSPPYEAMYVAAVSPVGRALLMICTFAFFLHLCGSIRHLIWDTTAGFGLRAIYVSGWAALAASIVLTAAAWVAGLLLRG